MNNLQSKIFKMLVTASKQRVLVPFYHKVTDAENTFANYLYTPRKISHFKNDLTFLKKNFTPVTLQKYRLLQEAVLPTKQNYSHITFDDGLANFYKVVAPLLLKEKIPATVFINTDFIDNKALFYRYKASLLYQLYCKATQKEKAVYYDFFEGAKNIKEKLFAITFNTKSTLDKLAIALNYSFNDFLAEEKPYLSSAQISELIAMGFTIGSHSKNHPFYAEISLKEQLAQTLESMRFLTDKFELNYSAFSFPFSDINVSKAFFEQLYQQENTIITFGTSGIKNDAILQNFQRLLFEKGNTNIENYLLKEYLKYFLKIPFFKNTMPRK